MRKRRPTTALPSVLLLFAFALTSCTPAIRVSRLTPAPYNRAAMLTNITIIPFTGPGAGPLTRKIETILSGIQVDDKAFFSTRIEGNLYYRRRVDNTGLPATSDSYGILSGTINKSRCSVEHYRQERTTCIESKQNGASKECTRWSHYKVDCFKSTATYGFSLQLRKKESGTIVYSLYTDGTQSSSACNSEPRRGRTGRDFNTRLNSIFGIDTRYGYLRCGYWTGKTLIDSAMNTAFLKAQKQIRHDIAPHYVTVRLALMVSEEGIESDEAKQGLKEGLELAKKMRVLKAQHAWLRAYTLAPLSVSITYNLGVSAEFFGRFKEAATLYKKAGELSKNSNRLIPFSIKRVEAIVKENRKLDMQMKSR